MLSLEQTEVYQEFVGGNFVVKKTNGAFNQVPIDQATEWVNTLCKLSNGIIGITKTDEIASASHGERGLLFLKEQSIEDEDESLTNRKDSFLPRSWNWCKSPVERFSIFLCV